jgi:hypothetical protein
MKSYYTRNRGTINFLVWNRNIHGDSYFAYVSQDNKFCVGYTNDYPLQHGKENVLLSDTEFEYAMNRP